MKFITKLALLLGTVALLSGCERPPIETVQTGYRGTGMEQIYNPRTLAKEAALNEAPVAAEAASADGPKASQVYQNVKVLGDLSVGEAHYSRPYRFAWRKRLRATYAQDSTERSRA